MAGRDDEFDWDDLKAGRLDEHEDDALGLRSGRASRQGGIALRTRMTGASRRAAPDPAGKGAARSAKTGPARQVAPFHFAHSFVSRPRDHSEPRAVRNRTRVVVYPSKAQVAALRKVPEARYHNRHRCWTVPRGHPFLRSAEGGAMNGVFAAIVNAKRRNGQGVARAANAPRRFQDYIERAAAGDARRAEEVEHDRDGAISVGNLGATRAERQGFWGAVEREERRVDARLQCRIIAEMPHWLTPEERRGIVEALGAEIGARGLGWWAAAHRPDVAKGSDPRNFHLHVAYHDRPVIAHEVSFVPVDGTLRAVPGGPVFDEHKDRDARGEAWVVGLKRRFAEIVNAVIDAHEAQSGRPPPFRYFPGSYEALGIRAEGQRHLGPRRTALERVGILTYPGAINVARAEAAEVAAYGPAARRFHLSVVQDDLWNFAEGPGALGRLHALLRGRIEPEIRALLPLYERATSIEAALLGPMGDPRAVEVAERETALRLEAGGRLPAAGGSRVERRAAAFDAAETRAAGEPALLAEIELRRADLLEAEAGLAPAEAGQRRRLLEAAHDSVRRRFVDRSRPMMRDAENAAGARYAAALAQLLAEWRDWAGRRARPRAGEALPSLPQRPRGWDWAKGTEGAARPPRPDAAERDELARRVRRQLDEAELQARLLAGRFGASGAVADAFRAETGLTPAELPDAFAALREAALARFAIRERSHER